jgi:hypothetical protein
VNRNVEGEAAAGAAARERCDEGTLHGTYLGANDGVVTGGLTRARSLRQSFSGLTATAIQRASFQLTNPSCPLKALNREGQ